MGKAQQQKGRRAEIELSRILDGYGYTTRPGMAVSFGGEPDVVGLPFVHCEIKAVERLNIPAALRQAAEDSQYFEDGLPTIFHKHRGAGWVVSMTLDDWLKLYDSAVSGGFGRSNGGGL